MVDHSTINSMSPFEIEQATLTTFDEASGALTRWGEYVDRKLTEIFRDLIDENRLKAPAFRLKDRYSYLKKALYRNKSYVDPLNQITDKVGTRLIALTTKEIRFLTQKVMECESWIGRKDRDFLDDQQNDPELFRYQSVHIILIPGKDYDIDVEYVKALSCEVQIRSALQHAHAEVSHDTTYKGPYRYDEKIKRLLSLSMALREATDDYFCKVYDEMKDEARKDTVFLNRLTDVFAKLKPEFDPAEVDYPLSDLLLQLWHKKQAEIDFIEQVIHENEAEVKAALVERNGYLFKQPIVLLVMFYIIRSRDFIRQNWPLGSDYLENAFNAMGYNYRES